VVVTSCIIVTAVAFVMFWWPLFVVSFRYWFG
jgi:hypothetical protein